MKIKLCGIRKVEQMEALVSSGADYAGIIFYSGSSRYIGEPGKEEAEKLKELPIKKIGVFVNNDLNFVKDAVERFDLFAVQLHGEESPEYCSSLQSITKVIKVFGVDDQMNVDAAIAPYMDVADFFLFDTAVHGKAGGGTGIKFSWRSLESATIGKPFFLSGGIGPDDIRELKNFYHPFLYSIDINSRFETAPGEKDLEKVNDFIKGVREK